MKEFHRVFLTLAFVSNQYSFHKLLVDICRFLFSNCHYKACLSIIFYSWKQGILSKLVVYVTSSALVPKAALLCLCSG